MKICKVCGARKRASAFMPRALLCRVCFRERGRKKIEESRRWIDEFARRWRRSAGRIVDTAAVFTGGRESNPRLKRGGPPSWHHWLRHEAIMAYGGYRCACCGEGEPMFLTIDHINGGGARHRRRIGSGIGMWMWLRKRGYPRGFRVLCSNCNLGRHINGGTCPHKKRRRRGAR